MQGRTGLFGGTFNPIHTGHLRVAEEALRQFGLREVVFIPTGCPPHRTVDEGTPAETRYTLVCLAVKDRPRFSVSRIEVDRPGPSYTVDTVAAMKELHPEGVAYIVGADIFARIETWRDWRRLLESCPFIVAPRPGASPAQFHRPPFTAAEVHVLNMPLISISSSELRRRYREGMPTAGMIPTEVDRWIREHGLYGVAARREGG
ncbi:MAG: Nicotinate-nucleotide adenylyltransferase [Candidatus Bipolaricaulis sibiricus]|uniref:Probable nicotinate-nucleotide adenylyltransferase n=1 Tax=Bipolaricaulis sibiricus TaxID=2501609 RepID=A0A410FUJ6_BIPS1|nr:MAG: Nicotinate-nucleotide adenylyltransferase [Candidatus Bipolaricaulis sibiricus]